MTIETDVQKLEPGAIVELFELDLTPFGSDLLRFHAGTNGLLANVTWNGNVYTRFPVAASGFEFTGQGQSPRPKLMVSNIAGAITALVLQYEDLVGAKVTRRRTLAKYLDAVNFPARRNLLTYTEAFDNAAWSAGLVSVSASAELSPAGTSTVDSVTETATTGQHLLFISAGTVTNGATYTLSVYARPKTGTRKLFLTGFGQGYSVFNPADGTIVQSAGNVCSATQLADGWWRFSAAITKVNTNASFYFGLWSTTPSYAGDGTSSIDLWGAQLELASTPSAYQPVLTTWSQNPTADPSAEFPQDIFYIDRKSVETSEIVEFELAPAMDITGVMLPRRQIIQNICPWRYRGSECGYTGTNYFDVTDVPVGSAGLDVCGKRLTSCKLRFGQYAELPFGGFPVAGLFR